MKRILKLSLIAFLFIGMGTAVANANQVFGKGDAIGSVTVGFGKGFAQRFALDYCVADGWINNNASLGIGASLNNTIGWHGGDRLSLVANCSFHYQFIENLDTYIVAGVGGGVVMAVANKKMYADGIFDWTSALGVRYYLSNAFAINFEAGYTNMSFINLGVTWRF